MSFGSKKEKQGAEQGITQTGDKVAQAGAMTPQEQAQYQGSFGTGQQIQQIIQYLMGGGQRPNGYQDPTQQYLQQAGPLGTSLYNTALQSAQDPYATYESNLQPSLQQAEDSINRQAQSRGLLRSGIPIEQMGRAGVELAIAEADKRMQYRNQELQRAGGMQDVISQGAGQNLANLSNLYQFQQGQGQTSMGRQSTATQNAGQYWAYPSQAALGSYYGGQAALQALPGQLGSAAIGAVGAAYNPYKAMIPGKSSQQISTNLPYAGNNTYVQQV